MKIAAAVLVALVLFAPSSYACSVCYGSTPTGPQVSGMNNAILFLLGIIGVVQVGVVALFLSFRKRARLQARRRESFRLIEGGYH